MKQKIVAIGLVSIFSMQTFPVFAQNTYYDYAKSGHEFYKEKKYDQSAIYYEKAYNHSNDELYKENAIVAHSTHANNLANNEKYDEAVKYCKSIINKYPDEKRIKEISSEVYYARGVDFFYNGKYKEAKQDFEKSFAYSVDEYQKDRAIDSMAKTNVAIKQGLKPKNPQSSVANMSIPNAVTTLEQKVYGKSYTQKPILERVGNLEKDKTGKTHDNESLVVRIQRLENQLGISGSNSLTKNDYINEVIQQSNGKINIFGKMPIAVYFTPETPKHYDKEYKKIAKKGFEQWSKANSILKFEYINNPKIADIIVNWSDEQTDYNWEPKLQTQNIEDRKKQMKYKKAGMLVNIGSIATMVAGALAGVPALGSIGSIGSGVASPYLQYKGMANNGFQTEITLGTKSLESLDKEFAKKKLMRTATHQMGHALGIYGHSPNPNDLMFEEYRVDELSQRDINTINEIYKEKTKDSK